MEIFKNSTQGKYWYSTILSFTLFISFALLSFVVSAKTDASLVTSSLENVNQQKTTITGTVKDINGLPLIGVNVVVENTTNGTQTDFDGNYKLSVSATDKNLVFSFVGYKTVKVAIGSKTSINVTMEEDSEQLEEVVITGYQTISKERSTGSFVKVSAAELAQKPAINIVNKLEGTAAGLNFTNGSIEIRGRSTMSLSASPLFVVDGFPLQGGLYTINAEDVESVTILKDASASSIWGVQASNGVVVITTKKGKKGNINVDFSSYLSLTKKVDYSDANWMSTSDQIDMDQEYIDKKWRDFPSDISRFQRFDLLEEAYIYKMGYAPNGDVWSQAQYNSFVNNLKTKNVTEQWEKYLLRSPLENNYNLSISGGGDKNNFFASLGYNDRASGSIGDNYKRTMLTIKDSYEFSKKFTFSASLVASLEANSSNGVLPTSVVSQRVYNDLVDENGQTIQYYTRWSRWKSQEKEAIAGFFPYTSNVLDDARLNDMGSKTNSVRANFSIDYELLKDLKFQTSFQYEKANWDYDRYYHKNSSYTRFLVNDMFVNNVYQVPVGDIYYFASDQTSAWDFRNTLNWDKSWNKSKLTVFGGIEFKKRYTDYTYDQKYGFDRQTNTYTYTNTAMYYGANYYNWNGERNYLQTTYQRSETDNRDVSAFTNLGYEFNQKYSLNASARIDQKNLFGSDPKYRYKPLWSAGIGWNLHKEDFMSGLTFINYLKLRATIGTGGLASNSFSPYALARNAKGSWGLNIYDYLYLTQAANDKLKWEETLTTNVAADFYMFNNRLGGTLEYYIRKSTDIIGTRQLDVTNGFSSAYVNYASMNNSGLELTLDGTIIKKKDFNWSVSTNISYNKNKVTVIDDQKRTSSTIAASGNLVIGLPLNNMYSFNYAGLDNGGNILMENADGSIRKWKTDGAPKPEDLIYHGATVAPYYGGLSSKIAYKGFDLTLNAAFKFGHVFRRNYGSSYAGWYSLMDKYWLDRWQKPGDELTTRVPKIAYEGVNPYNGISESHWDSTDGDFYAYNSQDFIYDAGFVRLRDVILGYTMPQSYLDKTFIKSLRLTAQVTNPYLWVANSKGFDPEQPYSSYYNNLKSITIGLKTTF